MMLKQCFRQSVNTFVEGNNITVLLNPCHCLLKMMHQSKLHLRFKNMHSRNKLNLENGREDIAHTQNLFFICFYSINRGTYKDIKFFFKIELLSYSLNPFVEKISQSHTLKYDLRCLRYLTNS